MDKIRTGVKKEQCVETSSRDTKKNNRPNIPCRSVCKLMKFRVENAAPLSLLNKGNVLQESWHTTEWMKTKNYDRKNVWKIYALIMMSILFFSFFLSLRYYYYWPKMKLEKHLWILCCRCFYFCSWCSENVCVELKRE